jgi:hypothetical protein
MKNDLLAQPPTATRTHKSKKGACWDIMQVAGFLCFLKGHVDKTMQKGIVVK